MSNVSRESIYGNLMLTLGFKGGILIGGDIKITLKEVSDDFIKLRLEAKRRQANLILLPLREFSLGMQDISLTAISTGDGQAKVRIRAPKSVKVCRF